MQHSSPAAGHRRSYLGMLGLALITWSVLSSTHSLAQPADDQPSATPSASEAKPLVKLVKSAQFAEALARIQALPKNEITPQIRFWQTWALASTDQLPAAIHAAKSISEESKSASAWRAHALQLCRLAEASHSTIQEHGQMLVTAGRQLKHAEVLSFQGTYHVDERTEVTGNFRLDQQTPDLNITVHRNQIAQLGLRFQNQTLHILPGPGSKILQYQLKQAIPTFSIVWEKEPENRQQKYNVMFGLGLAPGGESFQPLQIMNSPVINTVEGVDEMLHYTLKRGSFPREIQSSGKLRVLSWVTPEFDRPHWAENRVMIDENNQFVAIHLGQVRVTHIRYGQRSEIPEDQKFWEKQRAVQQGALNYLSLLGVVKKLMQTVYKLTRPAPRIADKPRNALG